MGYFNIIPRDREVFGATPPRTDTIYAELSVDVGRCLRIIHIKEKRKLRSVAFICEQFFASQNEKHISYI